MRRPLVALVALAVLTPLQTSCGDQTDDNADDTDLASIDQALVADWVHPSCAPSALMPPAPNTCGGPWRFTYSETWQNALACGEDATQACISNKTCNSWNANAIDDGLAATPVSPSTTSSASFVWSCSQPKPGGPTRCTGAQPRQDTCTTKAIAFKPQLIAGLATDDLGHTIPAGRANDIKVDGALHIISQFPRDPETGDSSTTWDCTFSISGVTKPSSNAWSVCGCAHYPAKTCERMSGSDVTAPGLPFPTSGGTPTFPEDGRVLTGATCLTCDQLPMVSDLDLQNKFACLDGGLPGATGELRSSLIARMKLLYQLSGERLTDAQRARIDALYDESPGASTSCSVAIPWESGCQATATPLGMPGPLQLCQDLASNDLASRAVAASQTQHCIDQLAKTAQLTPETCRLPLRDLADIAAQGVMSRSYPELTGDLADILPEVLARIGAWWSAGTTAAAGDRAWLLGHGNAVLRQLWISIERAKVPLPTGVLATDAAAAALLADITSTGFLDDFGVLSALFAPGQPPATPPVLTLTGDALQPVAERLVRLETVHDVGCRFAACKTGGTLRSSATSELVHALAVLPDVVQLTTVLASATHLAQQQPVLYAALSRMRDQHAYFDAAWAALGRSDPFAQLGAIVEPPSEVATLALVVRTATAAWSSYQDSGQFVSWHRPRLTSAALQQPALISSIDSLLGDVDKARAKFELARLDTVNDLLTQTRQQGLRQSAVDRITALLDQSADLVDRELGLEEREAQERAGIATYQKAFEALVNSHVLDTNAAFQTETLAPISASASSAKYPGLPAARDIAHDRFAMIRFRSRWSPSS